MIRGNPYVHIRARALLFLFEVSPVLTMDVISAIFLNGKNEMLLLKRSSLKRSYPNQWDTVAGKIEQGETPEQALYREVKEEIGITNFNILQHAGRQEYFLEDGNFWIVYPFLCRIMENGITLNEEHVEYQWQKISTVLTSPCIPPLRKDLSFFFPLREHMNRKNKD